MSDRKSEPVPDIGDATWAHNRWPVVGLYTGAGVGLALGVIFWGGFFWTVLYSAGLSVLGCLLGYALAILIYGRPGRHDRGSLAGGQLEPAGEDQHRHSTDEKAAGGDDDVGGIAGTEDETKHHGQ